MENSISWGHVGKCRLFKQPAHSDNVYSDFGQYVGV